MEKCKEGSIEKIIIFDFKVTLSVFFNGRGLKIMWHKYLYDNFSANQTINSKKFLQTANEQVDDIINLLGLNNKRVKILDVPCGTGRHLVQFCKRGYKITGIEINRDLINIAKDLLAKKKLNAPIYQGNMNNLKKFAGKFDLVTNLFSSIGYFQNDKENEYAISEILKTVRHGGKAIFETTHRRYIDRVYSPITWHTDITNKTIIAETRCFDKKTSCMEGIQSFVDLKTGKTSSHYHKIRLYRANELKNIILKNGAKKVQLYSDLKGNPFDINQSKRLILIASL
ncbi:MAG: class I SAM-dependent methyltransferase [Oligoflexia bacterium]|nr:class I SAM-dependent methyltransferase [Oligoflexia bacterium]